MGQAQRVAQRIWGRVLKLKMYKSLTKKLG